MILPKNCKVEKACSTNPQRYVLAQPYFNKEKSRLEMTTGSILAVLPVTADPEDCAGPVPLEAIKASRKGDQRIHLRANEAQTALGTFPKPQDMQFPSIDKVIPTYEPKFSVGINAELLFNLAQALGTATVKLEFLGEVTEIRVLPLGEEARGVVKGSFGVIMPIRLT